MDIKLRLQQILCSDLAGKLDAEQVRELARDALAEIEQLERGDGTYVCAFMGCREDMDPPRCPVHEVE